MPRFMNMKHHRHTTWLHICMKTQPSEEMTTILLTMENIISVCRAMGRTKGLCDLANQRKIFVMDLDAFRHAGWEFSVNESHTKGITCWFWHIVHLPSSGGFSCSTWLLLTDVFMSALPVAVDFRYLIASWRGANVLSTLLQKLHKLGGKCRVKELELLNMHKALTKMTSLYIVPRLQKPNILILWLLLVHPKHISWFNFVNVLSY